MCIHVLNVSAYLYQFVKVGVLACSVFVLVQNILHCLCAEQQLHLFLLVVQWCVVFLRKAADVWQPERSRVSPFTQQMEGQRHVAHGLQDPVLAVQRT